MTDLNRITFVPGVTGGRATVQGLRFTVGNILKYLAAGYSVDGLLRDFPYLERKDIVQALEYRNKPRLRRRLRKAQRVAYRFDPENGFYTLQNMGEAKMHLNPE